MIKQVNPDDIIVIDIETASCYSCFEDMDADWQQLWAEKVKNILPDEDDLSTFYKRRAGVMAEFGKVICICYGEFDQSGKLLINSFSGKDERQILLAFSAQLSLVRKEKDFVLAGHNIREFDIPFICRRMMINNIVIPSWLNFQNTKPWENNIYDTFQYWRFGDYKNYTSLKLLSKLMNVDSSKDDIDGSMVGSLYWESDPIYRELNIRRIEEYCKRDIECTAQIIKRFLSLTHH